MKVAVISSSPRKEGKTQHVMRAVYEMAKKYDVTGTVFINLADGGMIITMDALKVRLQKKLYLSFWLPMSGL